MVSLLFGVTVTDVSFLVVTLGSFCIISFHCLVIFQGVGYYGTIKGKHQGSIHTLYVDTGGAHCSTGG